MRRTYKPKHTGWWASAFHYCTHICRKHCWFLLRKGHHICSQTEQNTSPFHLLSWSLALVVMWNNFIELHSQETFDMKSTSNKLGVDFFLITILYHGNFHSLNIWLQWILWEAQREKFYQRHSNSRKIKCTIYCVPTVLTSQFLRLT